MHGGCASTIVSYPSVRTPCMSTEPSLPQGVLDKVRALLAKAESTTFDAEAEAFTAKAQELMARHRIDRAVFEAREHRHRAGGTRSVAGSGSSDPYADAKAMLLANVADANGCRRCGARARDSRPCSGSSTSSTRSTSCSPRCSCRPPLRCAGRDRSPTGTAEAAPPASGARSWSPLPSGSGSDSARPSTPPSNRPSPKPAAHSSRSSRPAPAPPSAAAEAAFPDTRRFRPSVTDGEGWHAGTRFADQADLSTDPELTAGPCSGQLRQGLCWSCRP